MTYDEFLSKVSREQQETGYRYGQAFFNTLTRVRPVLAEEVRGTPLDPFHDEAVSQSLHQMLTGRWDEGTILGTPGHE
jgi:hypothetical protein